MSSVFPWPFDTKSNHKDMTSHGFTMQCNMINTLHQIKNRKLVLKLSLYFIKVGKKLNKSSNSTKCNSCGFGFICNMGLFFLCILAFGFLVHVDIWQTTYLPDVDNRGHFTLHLTTSSCPRSFWMTPWVKILFFSNRSH